MQRVVMSTDDIAAKDRFSYWREEVGERLLGFSSERKKGEETPFKASVVGSINPCVARFRFRSDGYQILRRPSDIARVGWDGYVAVYREMSAGASFQDHKHEVVTTGRDLIVRDPTVPFVGKAGAEFDSEFWFFPRALFDPHLSAYKHQNHQTPLLTSGLGGMVRAYLDALSGQLDSLDDRETEIVADNFCRLLAAACGGDRQPEAARSARLAEVKRYLSLHLADPGLTPEKVAGALKVSVRQLHLLFEPSGTSFSRYILQRRLAECRSALSNPIENRSVTDVALAWGFNSLRTFNRAFRQTFGATPSELRARTE